MNLIDLIQYENENTRLDFKAVPYKGEQSEALLKDIMAMANAAVNGDRYIIVGVKHYPNEEREILGVEEYIDDASYYQLVHSNIEPGISLEYSYLSIDGKKVGYFRIFDCNNPPYMFKKDGNKFKRGDSYIRKGTSNMRLMRSDIDRIFHKRQSTHDLAGNIEVVFVSGGVPCEALYSWASLTPPSQEEATRIKAIIAEKEQAAAAAAEKVQTEKENPTHISWLLHGLSDSATSGIAGISLRDISIPGIATTYEQRDVPTLKKNLVNIEETYE